MPFPPPKHPPYAADVLEGVLQVVRTLLNFFKKIIIIMGEKGKWEAFMGRTQERYRLTSPSLQTKVSLNQKQSGPFKGCS